MWGYSDTYVRQMIRARKLVQKKEPTSDGMAYQYIISANSLYELWGEPKIPYSEAKNNILQNNAPHS